MTERGKLRNESLKDNNFIYLTMFLTKCFYIKFIPEFMSFFAHIKAYTRIFILYLYYNFRVIFFILAGNAHLFDIQVLFCASVRICKYIFKCINKMLFFTKKDFTNSDKNYFSNQLFNIICLMFYLSYLSNILFLCIHVKIIATDILSVKKSSRQSKKKKSTF